ncbi:hypothetical protein [Brevibacillus laterosporus]|uniref:Uncharacterized protein n=1 Tax=Brevibacillus laterosporus TaxID=1465 RepID=A0AAP8QGF3_BRELA|nr:hypothetical protein [Brevibacillus laterosporus]PPB12919.1 hypothetical protein C4A77_00605 [Brevibacillus laterosporus]
MILSKEKCQVLWKVEDKIGELAKLNHKYISPIYLAKSINESESDVLECLIHLQRQKKPNKGGLMFKVICPSHDKVIEEIRDVWLNGLAVELKDRYWCGCCIEYRPMNPDEIRVSFEISDQYLGYIRDYQLKG